MECPTQTIRTTPTPVSTQLQDHMKKARENYHHVHLVMEGLMFSAWLNAQRDLIDARRRKRAKQIAWALRGGRL